MRSRRAPRAIAERIALAASGRAAVRALDRVEPAHRVALRSTDLGPAAARGLEKDITESSLVATKSRVWRARREIEKRARRDPLLAAFVGPQEEEQ